MVFTVYVIHDKEEKDFKCSTKRDFLTKILKNYGVGKEELVLIDTASKKEISLDDICDEIKVEVKTRHIANGQRPETSKETDPIRVPNLDDLITKLHNNSVLTGLERRWLTSLVKDKKTENTTPNRKRRREDDEPIQTANKKLQVDIVNLNPIKSTSCTQTDPLNAPVTPKSRSSASSVSDYEQESKLLAKKDNKDPERVAKLMKETYIERRNFILLTNPVVSYVKERYPLLFTRSEVRSELNRIFYDAKDIEVLSNIKRYSGVILSLVDDDDPLLNKVNKKIKEASTQDKKDYAQQVGALLILSNVVNERRMYLNTEDEPCEITTYPRIEAPCNVEDLFNDDHVYTIIVENLVLCEAYDFVEAVLCLIATFFIFNISYSDKIFNTLVVMERVFLEANDTDGNDIDDSILQIIKLIQLKTTVKPKSTSKKH